METQAPTPLARARARISGTCPAKSGKSRWQWLSTSIVTHVSLQRPTPRGVREGLRCRQDRLPRLEMQRLGALETFLQPFPECDPAIERRGPFTRPRPDARAETVEQEASEHLGAVINARDLLGERKGRGEIGRRRVVQEPVRFAGQHQAFVACEPERRADRAAGESCEARAFRCRHVGPPCCEFPFEYRCIERTKIEPL